MDKFISLQNLSDIAALAAVLVLFVQFIKDAVDQVYKFRTRYLVFWLALAILLLNAVAAGQFTGIAAAVAVQLAVSIILNAIGAAMAAMKLYESAVASAVNSAVRGAGPPVPAVPVAPTPTGGALETSPPQPQGP